MFGTYRTLLAFAVVATHLLRIPSLGAHAVFGFFILSGYLMTTVMQRSYGYTFRGIRSFAYNRLLRLFPTYWVVVLLTSACLLIWGVTPMHGYHSSIFMPSNGFEWLQNLSLFYADWTPMSVTPRLCPPTWALTVELCFYALIALGFSGTKKSTIAWLSLGLIYTLYTHVFSMGYDSRYTHIAGGSLPFSIGAMIFHYKEPIHRMLRPYATPGIILFLALAFVGNGLFSAVSKHVIQAPMLQNFSFYLNLPINAMLIAILSMKPALPVSPRVDQMIGEFSYPIYLSHWLCGFVVSMTLFGHPARGLSLEGVITFLLALVMMIGFSAFSIRFIDRRIERLRSAVKSSVRKQGL